jgi:hypothetical protein
MGREGNDSGTKSNAPINDFRNSFIFSDELQRFKCYGTSAPCHWRLLWSKIRNGGHFIGLALAAFADNDLAFSKCRLAVARSH